MSAVRRFVLLGALALAVLPTPAEAGRRPFIWVWDTEIVPKGDVELEQWLWHQEEPVGSTSVYAQYCVARLIRECGIKVVLDGQGARTRTVSPEELVAQATSLLMVGMAAPPSSPQR